MISCMECEYGYIIDRDNRIADCSMFRFGDYIEEPEGTARECPCYKHDDMCFGKETVKNEN